MKLTPEQEEIKARVEREIQEWAGPDLRVRCELEARRRVADRLGIPLERIRFLNPRWSETTFEADGFEVV